MPRERDEGPLGDPANQRAAQKMERRARAIIKEDLLALESEPSFRRWIGRLCQRCGLTDVFDTDSGSRIFRMEGRRSIAVEVLKEFDDQVPGFYERVLAARRAFEQEIQEPLPVKESDDE